MTTETDLARGSEDNDLSERQLALVARAATHADDFATRAAEHDREGTFPFENFEKLHESGYMKQCLPVEHGGEDVTLEDLCLAQERLAYGDGSTALGANMHSFFVGAATERFRVEPANPQWPMLFMMVSQVKATLGGAISERESADPFNYPSGKVERAPGGYRVTGGKVFGSNTPASPFLFFNGVLEEDGRKKVLSFQVPKGTAGAEILDDWDTMGMRATGSVSTRFSDCFVPEMMKTQESDYGASFGSDPFQSAFLCWFEPTVASVYTGIGAAARDIAKQAVEGKSRLPFGEVKRYASVQYAVAEMFIAVESARALIRRSARRLSDPAWRDAEAIALAIATKHFATTNAVRVVDTAMEVVGGGAFFKRLPLERMYRDVRAGKFHPPSHYDALEIVGKVELGVSEEIPRFL